MKRRACRPRRERGFAEQFLPGTPQVLSFKDPKGTVIELFNEWSYLGNNQPVMGIGPLKLGHVAFVVPEPQGVAKFYGEVLGFRVSDWIGDFFVFMRCNADHHAVNFIAGRNVTMHHIAFELRDAAHLHGACDLFGDRKIPIIWGRCGSGRATTSRPSIATTTIGWSSSTPSSTR